MVPGGAGPPIMPTLGLSSFMHPAQRRRVARLSDRGCVLMVGVGLGAAIGFAFGSQNASRPDVAEASQPAQAVHQAVTAAPAPTAMPKLAAVAAKPAPFVPAAPATPF